MDTDRNGISGGDLLPPDETTLSHSNQSSNWRPSRPSLLSRMGKFRFVFAWAFIAAIGASLIWTVSWVQPQRTVQLSLIGAGYQENLTLNHNVYGWNSLDALRDLAQSADSGSARTLSLAHDPIVLNGDTKWDDEWDELDESTLVAFFAAHGAADEQGPYLIPQDASPDDESKRLPVKTVLQRLKELPSQTKKLLVLDAAHFDANWNYGILHNEFARTLKELNAEVEEIPNLVVVCASDVNQRSWESSHLSRTVFGHFFIEGLRGAAPDTNQDGRIDGEDLFRFMHTNVSQWVNQNYQAAQNPILLPLGPEGLDRAKRIDLVEVNHDYQPTSLKPLEFDRASQLTKVWDSYHHLAQSQPPPYFYSPARWRQYENSILRYEQLVRTHDRSSANSMLEQIDALHYQLEWDQHQTIAASQGNLFVSKAILGSSIRHDAAQQVLSDIWEAPTARRQNAWRRAIDQLDDSVQVDQMRVAVLAQLYDRAISDPVALLSKSAEISRLVLDPLAPPPTEINFLQVLNRHLPNDARTEVNADLIRLALNVRMMAEKAAVTYQTRRSGNSENVFPWIKALVLDGDRKRLKGEDLLFADASEREGAESFLNEAKAMYRKAISQGNSVRKAYDLKARLYHRMPHFVNWIASANSSGHRIAKETRLEYFEQLYREAHLLAELLARPNEELLNDAAVSTGPSLKSRNLIEQTKATAQAFASMEEQFESWWNQQASNITPDTLQGISLALSVPFGEPEQRVALVKNQQRMLNNLADRSLELAKPLTGKIQPPSATTSNLKRQLEIKKCQVQGRLALSVIGKRFYDQFAEPGEESFDQMQYLLQVFDAEERWWKSIFRSGQQIHLRLSRLSAWVDVPEEQNSDEAAVMSRDEKTAAWVSRALGGLGRSNPANNPNLVMRHRRQSVLFSGLAMRAERDHWYSEDSLPYYSRLARSYLETATRLWATNPELAKVESRLTSIGNLKLKVPERLDLTTENRLPFQIGVESEPGLMIPDGFPIIWVSEKEGVNLARPIPGQRLVQRVVDGVTPSPESCFLISPIDPRSQLERGSNQENPVVEVKGFFRGQTLTRQLDVVLHSKPNVTITHHQRPETATLAVRAADELHGLVGKGSGAVAIVLDASGSMGAPLNQPFDPSAKYYEATRALEKVLASLPDGVKVSIWIFGQATGPQKTVRSAEETIRRIVPSTVWDSQDAGQIDSILKSISYPNVEPWNESPIVETILAAKQDLLGESGFKTVLVLTDGMDNRYAQQKDKPNGQKVPDALRSAFDQTDITLNIVGFKVEAREERQARAQFEVVESFSPPGKYFEVKDAKVLADTLKSVLHQRIRYWVDDYSNQRLSDQRIKVEASRASGGEQWYPDKLDPGSYSLWTNADTSPFNLFVRRGDQLVVEFSRKNNQLVCRRAPFLENKYSWKPGKRTADWNVTAMQNRMVGADQLSLLVGFEKKSTTEASSVEVVRPHDVWFEVTEQGNGTRHPSIRWCKSEDFPVPAWRIEADDWTRDRDSNRATSPSLHVWWSPDRPVTPAIRYERNRDYIELTQLIGKSADIHGAQISIDDISVQSRLVEVKKGEFDLKPCLVVRASHSPGQQFWVRPTGTEFEGAEYLAFDDVGKFTGVFWPVIEDEVDRLVSGLEIVSLDDLKRQAESRGCYLSLDNLGTPRADDVALPPLNGFSQR